MGNSFRTVGSQRPPPGVYRDEPDRDDAASQSSAMSLHENIDFDSSNEIPPPYSDELDSVIVTPSVSTLPGVQQPPSPEVLHPSGRLINCNDSKGSKSTWLSPTLANDPVLLQEFVNYQKRVCPAAYVWIHGEHTECHGQGNNKKKEKVVDFDIKVDVSNTISHGNCDSNSGGIVTAWSAIKTSDRHQKTYRGTLLKSTDKRKRSDAEGANENPTLQEWCHLFCASSSKLKSFTIRHMVLNRNEEYLRNQINAIVRSTNYRGHITIGFQLNPRTITIQTPHVFNKMRHNKFIHMVFIVLQLWIITWPILFFMTKRWAVAYVHWPYNLAHHTEGQERASGRASATESEEYWLQRYRYTIQQGVLSRATNGTIIDYLNEGVHQQPNRDRQSREAEPQGGFVGGTLSLIRGVSNIIREDQAARGWGHDT